MRYLRALDRAVLVSSFMLMMASTSKAQVLQTVPYVNLNKYMGKWYEIASFAHWFQKGCSCTTAEYTLANDGHVTVENRCNKSSKKGKESYIKGKAFVIENSGNAKLEVQFFWPLKGKYWIIDLADDYSYAVVGHPGKNYLWILAREPNMSDSIYHTLVDKAEENGFDISKLKRTEQR